MTTLTDNAQRSFEIGDLNDLPTIASEIIYDWAAIGIVKATGHTRPLVAGDQFAGFATEGKHDNSAGAAAAINAKMYRKGFVQLPISGAVITDVGQFVYASDDDTFIFTAPSNSLIGKIKRFVSSGVAIVEFGPHIVDPFGGNDKRETKSAVYTLTAQDNSKIIYIDTDAFLLTLPATVVGYNYTFVCAGAYGAVAVNLSPDANDLIMGPALAGTDNKDLILTKATAQRGDYVKILADGANGWHVTDMRGVWAEEA